ncbi:hypothetical protein M2454_000376 [Aequitasia blattaphilus]|uniref:Uncharacterized protein n=1 Tax=Aequitasia blattaphilus TaxID=2949332 RepID=A0ABT1E5W6_9FIRM|nr:hypothetical protein [Aequitasia blattaphilus]MCP1101232.1 hypothetical protein [Aequitasia blattaphilus]MCR8613872.1 hypothetical protein [Aequitasia blattaphilus]
MRDISISEKGVTFLKDVRGMFVKLPSLIKSPVSQTASMSQKEGLLFSGFFIGLKAVIALLVTLIGIFYFTEEFSYALFKIALFSLILTAGLDLLKVVYNRAWAGAFGFKVSFGQMLPLTGTRVMLGFVTGLLMVISLLLSWQLSIFFFMVSRFALPIIEFGAYKEVLKDKPDRCTYAYIVSCICLFLSSGILLYFIGGELIWMIQEYIMETIVYYLNHLGILDILNVFNVL